MLDQLDQHISEETPPKAGAMINTFRAFGYNLQTAIADIVDNSISAKSENVWIAYHWAGEESWVSIMDDGTGMDKDNLVEAMTPGSKDPNDEREVHDLGRFGLGLKTASFSQCKRLTVITRKKSYGTIKRCWDLDYVNSTGKWKLLDYLSDNKFIENFEHCDHGTLVLWEKLDRLVGNVHEKNEAARQVFLEEFELLEEHLSLVFHRFIEKKRLTIWMNGSKVEAWDPFMKDSNGGQLVARESLDNDQVHVKCYVLPHISKLGSEDRTIAKTDRWYKLQGFYVYRNGRLLIYGDWLGLFQKNEHFKNARILIDIPNKLDHEWKIDIKKAAATPSLAVRRDLIRLGKLTRKAAGDVHRFRGNQIILDDSIKSFSFQPVWKAKKTRDDARHYYVNPEHPIIQELLQRENISNSDLKKVLKLIGEATPVESIIQFHSEDPEAHELRDFQKEPDAGTIELARMMYDSLILSGIVRELAVKQIFNIEPFNNYPQLIEYFK